MADALKHALFRLEDGDLVPQEAARSRWNPNQVWGMATTGALARGLENTVALSGRDDLRAARFTVDMSKAPSMDRCEVESSIVQQSSRLMSVNATLAQNGKVVARANAVFLKQTEDPGGQIWQSPEPPQPPPLDIVPVLDEIFVPYIHSDRSGWSQNFEEHQNSDRKVFWMTPLPVVSGVANTPFQNLAVGVDATNITTNLGAAGMQYINTDISVTVSRLPVGIELGLSAHNWCAHDGVGSGAAIVFDRQGPIGTSTVTCLAFARRALNFTGAKHSVD